MISCELLSTIRSAVADVQRDLRLDAMAARTERGETDHQPMMRAAVAAVQRVLEDMPE